ncbi:MAG TPA: MBL fold metallo-hydrolase [Puia sp.]|nr:MBL fold metallo-hydrolase [Puia sp.]
MAVYITSLNSGSNGNCYYIGNENEAILIDAGISCGETVKRMKKLGLRMDAIKAIFISHEHSDHIAGVQGLVRKFHLPIFITPKTYLNSGLALETSERFDFKAGQPTVIGNLSIIAFPKSHDAADPHSFMISSGKINVGVFTDIGYPCEKVIDEFKKCDAAFLESNYCEQLLAEGKYPESLKKRISSDAGHLSNFQALKLFTSHRGIHLRHLILSHLSRNNNKVSLVRQIFEDVAGDTAITVASRYRETPLIRLETKNLTEKGQKKTVKFTQLSIF